MIAHLRYFLESLGPEIRQYFIEADYDERPFSRQQRSVVYRRAKNALDKRPFGTQLDVYGSRSSKDGFFNKNDLEPEQSDVRKAAISNWEARAIAGLIGLQNLTRDDLKKFGIDVAKVPGVEYQTGAEGGGNATLISDAQGKRLFAIGKSLKIDDADAKALLAAYGFEHSSKITRAKYDEIVSVAQGGPEKVKAKIAALKATPTPQPVDPDAEDVPFGE